MQSNNGEDENQGQDKDNNGVDLQSGRLVGVKSYKQFLLAIHTIPSLSQVYSSIWGLTYSAWCCWSRQRQRPVCCLAWHWQASPSDQRQHVDGSQFEGRREEWERKVG